MSSFKNIKKNERKVGLGAPAIGGSSLLVIFAILCITVFAILSISAVNADTSLSRKSAEFVQAYYEADLRAEEMLSEIRRGEMPGGVARDGDLYSYSCAINETQELQVDVFVYGDDYNIKRWQTVYVGEWESDDSINVWDGQ